MAAAIHDATAHSLWLRCIDEFSSFRRCTCSPPQRQTLTRVPSRPDHKVRRARDPQRSHPAVRLGDVDAFDRLRPVAPGASSSRSPSRKAVTRAIDDVLTRHAIHTGGTVMSQHQPPRGQQHVVPSDPVIQGVEPELRLLLGLLTQLPSQFRDFRRQADPGLRLRWDRGLVPSAVWPLSSVVGRSSKRISSRLMETRIRQGTFAPRELPRFVATMSPSDSRPGRPAVMNSRRPSSRTQALSSGRPAGSLRFLD